jgi:hypothetical protein
MRRCLYCGAPATGRSRYCSNAHRAAYAREQHADVADGPRLAPLAAPCSCERTFAELDEDREPVCVYCNRRVEAPR